MCSGTQFTRECAPVCAGKCGFPLSTGARECGQGGHTGVHVYEVVKPGPEEHQPPAVPVYTATAPAKTETPPLVAILRCPHTRAHGLIKHAVLLLYVIVCYTDESNTLYNTTSYGCAI